MRDNKKWKKYGLPAVLLSISMLFSACAQTIQQPADDMQEGGTQEVEVQEPGAALLEAEVNGEIEGRIEEILSQMTLEEKAAQMMQPEQNGLTTSEVKKYGIGSVLSGGGSAPQSGNTIEDWAARVNELKQAALESRMGIPLLYGVDAVHGNNNVYGATIFPHNIALGAADNEALTEEIGRITAMEVRAGGIQWTFAPTLGNPQSLRWGRSYECFGDDTAQAAKHGTAYIRGFQGVKESEEYLDEEHVLACAKHFIGEGYTKNGKNQGNVEMSQEEFEALLASGVLNPYTEALDEGVRTVMVSYNSVDGVKCHENRRLIQELLKDELGFDGLVISDYNGVQQNSGVTYKEQIRQALEAGIDLFMEPYSWKECMDIIVELVQEGTISLERVDDSVRRILRVKLEAGLFEEEVNGATEQTLRENFGSAEHRKVARQAVRESLVLLKNEEVAGGWDALSALNQAKNIQVIGQAANDIGIQCGGWTISWQGMKGDITQGTTIFEGFQKLGEEKGIEVTHDITGSIEEEAQALVVVVGELPYAETDGDRGEFAMTVSQNDKRMLQKLTGLYQEEGKELPVIAVIVGGRPLDIAEYEEFFDAVVMAWLPGTEGDGVAEVLLGEEEFCGKLPVVWKAEAGEKTAYEKGFGLTKEQTLMDGKQRTTTQWRE